jgi:hypothetical protein
MSGRSVPRTLVCSIAFFGVFVGHELTYVVLAGNPVVRSTMLATTGHGYLPVTVHTALALALIGLAAIFLGRLGVRDGTPPSVGRLLPWVAVFQILTFTAIELAERVAASAPLRDLTHVLPVGAVAQAAVALVVAIVIRFVLRAADAAADALADAVASPSRGTVPLISAPTLVVGSFDRPVPRGRGPPR